MAKTPDRAARWAVIAAGLIVWTLLGFIPVFLVFLFLPLYEMLGVAAGTMFGTVVLTVNDYWSRNDV
jgi:hypothetical protein